MATYNVTGVPVASGVPTVNDEGGYQDHARSYVLKGVIDLTSKTTASGLVVADVYQCLAIPADTLVLNVFVKVATAATGTLTIDVGDASDADDWDEDVDVTATAGTVTYGISGTDTLCDTVGDGQGKLYTTADTIDITIVSSTGAVGPKLEIYALCVSIN